MEERFKKNFTIGDPYTIILKLLHEVIYVMFCFQIAIIIKFYVLY